MVVCFGEECKLALTHLYLTTDDRVYSKFYILFFF